MPKIKLRNPSVFRSVVGGGVATQACDSHFASLWDRRNRLEIDLSNACQTCIWFTTRLLLRGVQQFDTDHNPDLRQLKLELNRAVDVKDTTILERTLRSFLAPVDKSALNFQSPDSETRLVLALDELHLAVEQLVGNDYDEAVASTVRCRASLRWLGIGE